MKTGQIIRKAVLQLLQEYEFRVAEAKKALNDFCACAPNDLDNFDVLNAKFEDAKKHQFDVADKLAFMLSRYADQLVFSDEPLAETLDDLIALAASEETLTAPVVVPEDSPAADPVVAPEDSPAVDPVVALEDSPAADSVVAPEDSPAADPVVAPEDSPAADPVVAPEDSPAMSAKCKLCPSCVDGRCFFVPDIYDSVFPCQSPAWDDFFKSGGSRSPAPRARASPL